MNPHQQDRPFHNWRGGWRGCSGGDRDSQPVALDRGSVAGRTGPELRLPGLGDEAGPGELPERGEAAGLGERPERGELAELGSGRNAGKKERGRADVCGAPARKDPALCLAFLLRTALPSSTWN